MEPTRRARNRIRAVGGGVAVLALGAAAALAGGAAQEPAGAAPNPISRGERSATITLDADDGSYRVRNKQAAELLDDEYELSFDLAMHDGFRAPDDEKVGPPPYLRPEYVLEEATFDGEPGPADFTREGHLLTAEVGGDVAEGEHEGAFHYSVSGAALPTDDGYEVYVRSADLPSGGHTEIDGSALSNARITGLRCQLTPLFLPCGEEVDPDHWQLIEEPGDVIIIELHGAADSLVPAVLDRE